VREFLPLVQTPTLVLNRPDNQFIPIAQSKYIAEHIPGARFVQLPGSGLGVMGQHVEGTVAVLREFLTGAPAEPESDRVLATVLFTDIVDSTGRAAALGDRRWREILDRHDRAARSEVERFRGRFVKSTGDGILATFDAPTRALRLRLRARGGTQRCRRRDSRGTSHRRDRAARRRRRWDWCPYRRANRCRGRRAPDCGDPDRA
jgi:hypothetical protein